MLWRRYRSNNRSAVNVQHRRRARNLVGESERSRWNDLLRRALSGRSGKMHGPEQDAEDSEGTGSVLSVRSQMSCE